MNKGDKIAIGISIISLFFSGVALFLTYHQNTLDEANLQLNLNEKS